MNPGQFFGFALAGGPLSRSALRRILRRTARRVVVALRRLHDTLSERWNEIVALAEHRPPLDWKRSRERAAVRSRRFVRQVHGTVGYSSKERVIGTPRFVGIASNEVVTTGDRGTISGG